MTRPIVVGLALREDDAAPLALGRALAGLSDLPLALVTSYPRESRAGLVSGDHAMAVRQAVREQLERVAETLEADHHVPVLVRAGSAGQVLYDVAEHYDAAAVVVGSSHHGTVGRVLMGDVAGGLLHGAPCPVAVAPRGYSAPADGLRRIGVAFTDTPEGRQALVRAAELAQRCGGSIHSFTAVEPVEWTTPAAVPGWAPPVDLIDSSRIRAQRSADMALELLPSGLTATSEVVDGPPLRALTEASATLDLLVCGSRGYGGLRSVMVGGVSRGLAHHAHCPLLVVRRGAADLPPVRADDTATDSVPR
jgi:nucleotide-binding universal stress UspA family protein